MAEELLETVTMMHTDPRRRRPKRPKNHNSSACTGRPDASTYIGEFSAFQMYAADSTAFVVVIVVLLVFIRTAITKRARNARTKNLPDAKSDLYA